MRFQLARARRPKTIPRDTKRKGDRKRIDLKPQPNLEGKEVNRLFLKAPSAGVQYTPLGSGPWPSSRSLRRDALSSPCSSDAARRERTRKTPAPPPFHGSLALQSAHRSVPNTSPRLPSRPHLLMKRKHSPSSFACLVLC